MDISLFEQFSLSFDNKWIVLEIGSAFTKCGIAGKYSPRYIVPSHFIAANSVLSLLDPTKGTEIEWRQALENLLREIFLTFLGIGPGHNIVVVDSLVYPLKFRKALAYVLFRKFKMGSIKYCLGEATPLYTLPPILSENSITLHSTALIIDVGFKEARLLPIYEGIALVGKYKYNGAGAFHVLERLRSLLQEHGPLSTPLVYGSKPQLPSPPMSSEVLEDILCRGCFVSLRAHSPENPPTLKFPPKRSSCIPDSVSTDVPEQQIENKYLSVKKPTHTRRRSSNSAIFEESKRVESIHYNLSDGSAIEVNGYVRAHAADVLFENDYYPSIATLLLDCLLECEVDIRIELISSIILCGGITLLPGFLIRLIEEVEELYRLPKYSSLKSLSGQMKVFSSNYHQNTLSWTGASLVAQLQEGWVRVSSETYDKQEDKTIPDWTGIMTGKNKLNDF